MDVFQLLDEDQRYQLFILRFLDLSSDEYITTSRLTELTGQSKFKLTRYIQALNFDLHKYRKNCKVMIEDELVRTVNVDLTIIKLVQIEYFKTSTAFPLLIYLIEERGTIEKYATENFLSTSKAYAARRQLINFFKPLGIKVKKNQLIGEEFNIRNVLSTLIFESLNGYYSPFIEKFDAFTKKVNEFLTYFYDLRLTPTQFNKLNVLIEISLVRCIYNYHIKYSFYKDKTKFLDTVKNSIEHLSSYVHINYDSLVDELSYISMFLSAEGLLKDTFVVEFDYSYFEKTDNDSYNLGRKILNEVEKRYNTSLSAEIHNRYIQGIKQANRKRTIYSFDTSSFSTNKQIQSINELYPIFSHIIWNVVNDSFQNISKEDQSRYYYDYLFLLLDVIPPDKIESPIYVCVDFSQGKNYNHFITKQIEGFKDLNIVVENRVTKNTDILISNCVWERFNGVQIVWKNPPTPSDWEFFGNSVISVKKERTRENLNE